MTLRAPPMCSGGAKGPAARVADPPGGKRLGLKAATGDRRAINQLVVQNTRLIPSSVGGSEIGSVFDRDDDFQEACLGLIRAAEKFDVRKGFKFSTYATLWIKQAVARARADRGQVIRLPVHIIEQVRPVRGYVARYERRVGVGPETSEIARNVEKDSEEVAHLLRISQPVLSLDSVGDPRLDEADRGPYWNADDVLLAEQLVATLERNLGPRERTVILLRFGIGLDKELTLDEDGRAMGITRERVRQIQGPALERLQSAIGWALD